MVRRAQPCCTVKPQKKRIFHEVRGGVLRWHLSEAHDAVGVHRCDGSTKATTAIGEHTKSTDNKTNDNLRFEFIPFPERSWLGFNRPHFTT
jgi:hypothetical protein